MSADLEASSQQYSATQARAERRIREREVVTLRDTNHVNQFEDVHAKIRAFIDRLIATSEKDLQNRQQRSAKDAEEALRDVGEPAPNETPET
jgi:hypothetical protein